ncbi:hypothetical protein B6U82_00240 [Candidatus Pacearchaeota archaeon ex4484_31]|nr:MAG: hypothetical protein B6U82_00240 [Candidatus Pacearchaeota archaeon ex4484_31]
MFFWFFGRRKEIEKLKQDIRNSFASVKEDMKKMAAWIKHLDTKDNVLESEIASIKNEIEQIKENIDEISRFISFFDARFGKKVFKQVFNKQTAVEGVQTPVQTGVQTPRTLLIPALRGLSTSERLIVWALLNTDLKLSCEDLAVLLGKDKATIRGQINNIKQKSEFLIKEIVEKNGKKRYFIDEKTKEMLLEAIKIRKSERKNKLKRTSKKKK